MVDARLRLDDVLEDVRRRAAWEILVHDEERAGLLGGSDERVTHIERQERANVDDLNVNVRRREILCGLERDAAERAVRDDGDVGAFAQQLRDAERQGVFTDVRGNTLLE